MVFLFFILFIFPITAILLLIWAITKNKFYGKVVGILWMSLISLLVLVGIIGFLTNPKKLKKKDYYGEYIVHRQFFKGYQADWQYNTFRFEIKKNDSIYFYVTDKETILESYVGSIKTVKPYESERLIIKMEEPTHHILTSNPTIYRSAWSFYLVLESPKFNNVFFKKGKWKAID